MPTHIQLLSEQTINQIAAGEVIENPASVVKELVENAVDAGATKIYVETLGGGHQKICVSDNGSGMGGEDALLSLERHATSKIQAAEDLFALATMGFRGEALASIGAISKMTLLTALDGESGTLIEVEGGRIVQSSPGARSRGTTIEVCSLFYNVPARKKFQKGSSPSAAEITKVMTQLALAHPEVGFELVQQGRVVFSVDALKGFSLTDLLQQRSGLLLGKEFQEQALKMESIQGPCSVQGMIGSPLVHRHNRSGQYVFINRRPVISPPVFFAMQGAYGTRLSPDRHPVYIAHLMLPPEWIDVNVHPQKSQVRLREEGLVRGCIHQAAGSALQRAENVKSPLVVETLFHPKEQSSFDPPIFPLRFREGPEEEEEEMPLPFKKPHVIGIYSHYLILDARTTLLSKYPSATGLLFVDLQAASARVVFESLLEKASQFSGASESQKLLIPVSLSLSTAEIALIEQEKEALERLGIELHASGKNGILIDALPPFVAVEEAEEMVHELIETLHLPEKEARVRSLARTASLFARARKKVFVLQEGEELFKQLLNTSSPYFCPHGKPIIVTLVEDEIAAKYRKEALLS